MTIFEEVYGKLTSHKDFRERRFRAKYLAILALRANKLEEKFKTGITLEELAEVATSYESYNRTWRQVMELHPELHGEDYGDGKPLAQEKQISLGYEAGFAKDLKEFDNR